MNVVVWYILWKRRNYHKNKIELPHYEQTGVDFIGCDATNSGRQSGLEFIIVFALFIQADHYAGFYKLYILCPHPKN
jgi:hypothetical protein